MNIKDIIRIYPPTRVFRWFILKLANILPLLPQHRSFILKFSGMDIGRGCLVYKDVHFDTVAPERVHIGDRAVLTSGSRILTHFINPLLPGRVMRVDDVYIGADSFIGIGVIICNSVRIGDGAIVGAGSVVTKDIPEYEVWAGNPAKFIKIRQRA